MNTANRFQGSTMPTLGIRRVGSRPVEQPAHGGGLLPGVLLVCGILSSLLYVTMLVLVPLWWEGYSSADQAVSELSAIGAPTRSPWVSLAVVWALLYAAFGCGVWLSAGRNRNLRVAGAVIVAAAVLGLFWPPMHQREVLAADGRTLTDTLHIVWTAVNGVLTLLAMGFGAAALGKGFRLHSIATMAVLLASGAWTGTYAARMEANLPTPGMGVWERISIGAWLLWVGVFAIALLRARWERHRNDTAGDRPVGGREVGAEVAG
jgi:hypothetical protein